MIDTVIIFTHVVTFHITHPCIFRRVRVLEERPDATLPSLPQSNRFGIARVPEREPLGHFQLVIAVPVFAQSVSIHLVAAHVGGPAAETV